MPYLDALLEWEMAQRMGLALKLQRGEPAPPVGQIHIPCCRGTFGGLTIPRSSAPIYLASNDRHEFVAKRLGVEFSDLLADRERKVVAVGNAVYKSYRLPLRARCVSQVVWFCAGHRAPILKLLKSVHSIGKKRSVGYGVVAKWTAEPAEHDWSWFAKCDAGTVLMRAMPWCNELPKDLLGFRRDFGACQAPMWHPDRYREIVVPC